MNESQVRNMQPFSCIKVEPPSEVVKCTVTKPASLSVRITNCGEIMTVPKSFEVQVIPNGWTLVFGNECPPKQDVLQNKTIRIGSEFVFPLDFPAEPLGELESQLPRLMKKALETLNSLTPTGTWVNVGNNRCVVLVCSIKIETFVKIDQLSPKAKITSIKTVLAFDFFLCVQNIQTILGFCLTNK